MSRDNILTEFTTFIAKSAEAMLAGLPAASAISATPTPAPANNATQSQALVTPPVTAPAAPRTAAMPAADSTPAQPAPKPITNTSKVMKPTNYNTASKN